MRQQSILRLKICSISMIALLGLSVSHAQMDSKINMSNDTISRTNAIGARNTFANSLRGNGKKASDRIKLPVDKLKEIMDACTAKNITEVSVMVITIRQEDLVQARKQNPGVADNDLRGSQMLVFRVPRRAFSSLSGAKVNVPKNNSLMISLLGAGLILLDSPYTDLPFGTEDVFFALGSICPPPTSCDTE